MGAEVLIQSGLSMGSGHMDLSWDLDLSGFAVG